MTNRTKSDWQSIQLSRTFLKGVRDAIPGADLQLAIIGKITRQRSSS